MKTYLLNIKGFVQGVSFRHYANKKADELGISGYAKNIKDGSLEILCTGKKSDLERFIDWCSKGPEDAKVKTIDVKEIEPDEKFSGFEIMH